MNDIVKVAGIGFMGGILALMVKKDKPEFAIIVSLACAIMISFDVIAGVRGVIDEINNIISRCGMDIKYISVSVKAIGIAYVSQFAAEILRDGGEGAIASKVEMAGKVSILIITVPLLGAFLDMCTKVVQGV